MTIVSSSCKVAVIGAGFTAREHIRALRDLANVQVAALHSRTRPRAEAMAREFDIPLVCDSIPELYERTRADLVFVTVPELAANPVAKASFVFPWTVMMEKPTGYNLADALDIQSAAEIHQSKVLVALNRRFLSATLQTKAEVGGIAGPRFIKVQDQQNQSDAVASGQPQEVVRNYMYANSIHTIDYLRVFGRGRIRSVEPILRWDAEHPSVVVARIGFDSGDVGLYEGIWHCPGPWAVTVTVERKRWEMRPLERLTTQELGQPPNSVECSDWDKTFKPGFRLQAQAAVACARGEPSDAVSLADAIETMRLISRIFA